MRLFFVFFGLFFSGLSFSEDPAANVEKAANDAIDAAMPDIKKPTIPSSPEDLADIGPKSDAGSMDAFKTKAEKKEKKNFFEKLGDKGKNGEVLLGLYYNAPMSLMGGVSFFMPSEQDFESYMVQMTFGKSLGLKIAQADISNVGFAYSLGGAYYYMLGEPELTDQLTQGKSYIGPEIGLMFSLVVVKWSLLAQIGKEDGVTNNNEWKSYLTVGIGVF